MNILQLVALAALEAAERNYSAATWDNAGACLADLHSARDFFAMVSA